MALAGVVAVGLAACMPVPAPRVTPAPAVTPTAVTPAPPVAPNPTAAVPPVAGPATKPAPSASAARPAKTTRTPALPATPKPAAARTPPPAAPAPAATAAAPAAASRPAGPALDLGSLEQRLRDTKAIGLFTKLSLKNQVDDLLARFRDFYDRKSSMTLAQLRQHYDLLLLKVLSVLQDGDPALATTIASSRESIWAILADPQKFGTLAH